MPGDEEDVDVAEETRIAQRHAVLIAPGDQHPQNVVRGALPPLGDSQPQGVR